MAAATVARVGMVVGMVVLKVLFWSPLLSSSRPENKNDFAVVVCFNEYDQFLCKGCWLICMWLLQIEVLSQRKANYHKGERNWGRGEKERLEFCLRARKRKREREKLRVCQYQVRLVVMTSNSNVREDYIECATKGKVEKALMTPS